MENKKIATPLACYLLAVSVVLGLINTVSNIFNGYFSFFNLVMLAANAGLCVVLYMKRRDILLLGIIAIRALLQLVSFFMGVGLLSLLSLLAWVALLALAASIIEQDVVKLDLSKIADYLKKFYYLPAAIMAFCTLIGFFMNIGSIGFFRSLWSFITGLIPAAAAYFLAQWLLDPYEKETPAAAPVYDENGQPAAVAAPVAPTAEGYYNLGLHIVLSLFTCGIWTMIWVYRTTKFLNTAPGAEQHNPANKLLLCLFIPFYMIYWFYKQGQRIDYYARVKNLPHSDMATLCLILGIFIPIVAVILMQDRINTICTAQ